MAPKGRFLMDKVKECGSCRFIALTEHELMEHFIGTGHKRVSRRFWLSELPWFVVKMVLVALFFPVGWIPLFMARGPKDERGSRLGRILFP
jgi:hypothetical protein